MGRKIAAFAIPVLIVLIFCLQYGCFTKIPAIKVNENISEINFTSLFLDIQKAYQFQEKKSYILYHDFLALSLIFSSQGNLDAFNFSVAVEKDETMYDLYHFEYDDKDKMIRGRKIDSVEAAETEDVMTIFPAYLLFEILDEYKPITWIQNTFTEGDLYQVILWRVMDAGQNITQDLMTDDFILTADDELSIIYHKPSHQRTHYFGQAENPELNEGERKVLSKPVAVFTTIPLLNQQGHYSGSPQYHVVIELD